MKRILVAGGGLIGARHLAMVADHPDCQLVGLVDPDPRRHVDGITSFPNLSDVDVQIDGIIIATPTSLHSEQGIFAAQRGWDMLIEKPVADTIDAAKQLTNAVDHAGVASLVGHHRRYHSSLQTLKALIANGDIGEPITATLIWAVKKPDDYFQGNWRVGEGSPITINLVHDVDVLRFVLGEVTDVVGFSTNKIRNAPRVESGAVALRMESGATATISFADTAPSPWGFEAGTRENPNIAGTGQDMFWITGTKGAVSFPSMTVWTGSDDWSQAPSSTQIKTETVTPLAKQLDHFVDVMDRKAKPLIDIKDATKTLETTLEIQRALEL